MTTGFAVAVAIFVIALLAESVTSWMVIRGARRRHPRLWHHAGEPTLWGNGDLVRAWPLVRYFLRRDYRGLGDTSAVAFAERMRLPFVATYFMAWVGAACALLFIWGRGG